MLSNSTKGGIRLSYSKNPLGVRQPSFSSMTSPVMGGMSPGMPMSMSMPVGMGMGMSYGLGLSGYSPAVPSPAILMGSGSASGSGSFSHPAGSAAAEERMLSIGC